MLPVNPHPPQKFACRKPSAGGRARDGPGARDPPSAQRRGLKSPDGTAASVSNNPDAYDARARRVPFGQG